jgi:hypothetical protein
MRSGLTRWGRWQRRTEKGSRSASFFKKEAKNFFAGDLRGVPHGARPFRRFAAAVVVEEIPRRRDRPLCSNPACLGKNHCFSSGAMILT